MSLNVASGDLLNVRLNYGLSAYDDVGMNVLHYKVGSVVGAPPAMSAQLSSIAQAVFNLFAPKWAAGASADARMTGCTATDVFPVPRSVATTYTPGAPTSGLIVSDALPLQDAPTLLKKTDVGQRWGTGRLYYFGVPEDGQHDGLLEPAEAVLLNTMAVELATGLVVTNGGWTCTLGPVLVSGPEDNPTRITPITSGRLSDITIKTQRRRRMGKGI